MHDGFYKIGMKNGTVHYRNYTHITKLLRIFNIHNEEKSTIESNDFFTIKVNKQESLVGGQVFQRYA